MKETRIIQAGKKDLGGKRIMQENRIKLYKHTKKHIFNLLREI